MKPNVVKVYNSLKGGVDTLDKATGGYSCKRRTNRYSMSIIFNLIDLCSHNAFHTFRSAHQDFLPKDRSSKYKFLDWLSKELALEYVKERSKNDKLPLETRAKIESFLKNWNDMYGATQNPIAKCFTCEGKCSLKNALDA